MKNKLFPFLALVLVFNTPLSTAFAQGSLTPPGAPAPTMRSLDQIEPRTPISSVPFTITNAGSYYLTTNLTMAGSLNGITISANNVTVDLNGFALTKIGINPGYGIYFAPTFQTNVVVRNGSLSGWNIGVFVSGVEGNSRNIVLDGLVVSSCVNNGIFSSSPTVVRHCLCNGGGFLGISVTGGEITDCEVSNNGNNGIEANDCIVSRCRAANNGFDGIYVAPGRVSGCLVENNGRSGIYIDIGATGSEVIGNTCIGNNITASTNDAGIYVNNSNNRIEDNHVSTSGYAGISVNTNYSGNIIVKNSVSGNGANNYLTLGNQVVGPLITTFGTITNSNPWANFSY